MSFRPLLIACQKQLLSLVRRGLVLLLLSILFWIGWHLYQIYEDGTTEWRTATLHFCDGRPDYTGEFAIKGDSLLIEEVCDRTITTRRGKHLHTRCVEHHDAYRDRQGQEFPLRNVRNYTLLSPSSSFPTP